jgi:uncharacterized protein with HEPN domain
MPKDPTIAIRDCLTEIGVLRGIAMRMTLGEFRNDPIVRRAAAYAIQTISEAVRHIPDDWLAEFPTEPWGQIKGIGNRIRHEYFRLDDRFQETHHMKPAGKLGRIAILLGAGWLSFGCHMIRTSKTLT